MTDFRDACFGCGGHLRQNVHSGNLCPPCEQRHQRGEITAFGQPLTGICPTSEVRELLEGWSRVAA